MRETGPYRMLVSWKVRCERPDVIARKTQSFETLARKGPGMCRRRRYERMVVATR